MTVTKGSNSSRSSTTICPDARTKRAQYILATLPSLKVESVDKLILAIQSRITHYDTLHAIYANRQVAKRKFFARTKTKSAMDTMINALSDNDKREIGWATVPRRVGSVVCRQEGLSSIFDDGRCPGAYSSPWWTSTARVSRVCAVLERTLRECFAEVSSARFTVFPSAKDEERRGTATC